MAKGIGDGLLRFRNGAWREIVEVVRCKDCKHQNEDGDCDIHDEWFTRTPDDFCSYGERKTYDD